MIFENEDFLPKRVKMISFGDSGAGKSALIKVIIMLNKYGPQCGHHTRKNGNKFKNILIAF